MPHRNDFAYLVKISPEANNNRYYKMTRKDSIFVIEMGRVGAAPVTMKRPMTLWSVTLQKKLKEGYVDRSFLLNVSVEQKTKYGEIEDPDVRELFDTLLFYANQSLEESYTVSYQDVTSQMIEQAQDCISEIVQRIDETEDLSTEDLAFCNKRLLQLFSVIPRKMKDVSENLIASAAEIPKILEREQSLLDVMAAKIKQEDTLNACSAFPSLNFRYQKKDNPTILDAFSLNARICTEEENQKICKFLSLESAPFFKKAYRIRNQHTDEAFQEFCSRHGIKEKDIHYHYHGSRNRNYIGLITEGVRLNPKAPTNGKMFGYGLYFANRARKSIGYTDLKGSVWVNGKSSRAFLAVYKVAYQNPLHVSTWESWMSDLRSVKPHDALYAHAGKSLHNDEIIVYRESQATLQYLIELQK